MQTGVAAAEGLSLEGEGFIVADGVGYGVVVDGRGMQMQIQGTVLAMGAREADGVGASVCDGDAVPGEG